MDLQQQITSLTLSKRLKELGVSTPSYFWWRNDYPNNPGKYLDEWYIVPGCNYPYTYEPQVAVEYDTGLHLVQAFSVAELIYLCGDYLRGLSHGWYQGTHDPNKWYAMYIKQPIDSFSSVIEGSTPEEAVAKLLIHLIEHGLIKV